MLSLSLSHKSKEKRGILPEGRPVQFRYEPNSYRHPVVLEDIGDIEDIGRAEVQRGIERPHFIPDDRALIVHNRAQLRPPECIMKTDKALGSFKGLIPRDSFSHLIVEFRRIDVEGISRPLFCEYGDVLYVAAVPRSIEDEGVCSRFLSLLDRRSL